MISFFSKHNIKRKRQSAVASAAYISGEKIKNEWDGVTHDYTRKKSISKKYNIDTILKKFIISRRMNGKIAEKNSNAQALARQFIIGLPKELTLIENKNIVEKIYKRKSNIPKGMIVDYAIHDEVEKMEISIVIS